MKFKLKRIAPLQAGKMLGAFYGLISLIFIPFMLVFMAVGSFAGAHQGGVTHALPVMMGMGIGFMIFLPILYALIGFVGGIISAFIYNLMARWIGGFELEFEPVTPPSI